MKREMTDLESLLSREAYAAIQQATNSTARSQQQAEFRLGVSNIGHCFAGETEVPTREGIRPIASLAGGEAELLVPTRSGVRAEWRRVEVRAFGVQPLMRITLSTLGGVTREVYATADHEWFVTRSARNRNYSTVRTQDLVPGQRMREARAIGDRQRDGAWSVVSVEETDRVEEVYCAVVPGEEAFVLTEGLATHNCREYARRMVKQMPFTDVRDKTAAFLGTVIGDAVERALAERHPGWVFQPELTFTLPSGGEILGHADIVIPWEARTEEFPQAVIDIKTRAELDSIRRYGASQQQAFQKAMYCSAAIDAGLLNPEEPIIVANMWIDRSGVEVTPYVLAEEYDPNILLAVDAWVEDVKYAVIHDEEASRDKPREWCWSYCEHATGCRGNDTDAEGLIDDPEALAAVETYVEAGDLEREAKRMKNSAKIALRGVNGSTGSHTVRWVEIGETSYEVHREASVRLDVRPVPKRKATTA